MAEFLQGMQRAFGPTGEAAEDFVKQLMDALLGRPEVREQYQFGEMPLDPWPGFKVIKGGKGPFTIPKDMWDLIGAYLNKERQLVDVYEKMGFSPRWPPNANPRQREAQLGALEELHDMTRSGKGLAFATDEEASLHFQAKSLVNELDQLRNAMASMEEEMATTVVDTLRDLLGLQRGNVSRMKEASKKLKRRPAHFPKERKAARDELAGAVRKVSETEDRFLPIIEQITKEPMSRPLGSDARMVFEKMLRELGFGDLLE